MADVTFSTATICRPYQTQAGCARIRYFEESTAASTSLIAYGQVVSLDVAQATAGHRIVQCSSAEGVLLSTSVVGVAAEASTGVKTMNSTAGSTNAELGVYVADQQTEFLMPFKGTIASSLAGGVALELGWDSTNRHNYVGPNSTAGDRRFWVTQVLPGTAGDTNGFVVGKFTSTIVPAFVANR